MPVFQSGNFTSDWRVERKERASAALPWCLEKQHIGCSKHTVESVCFILPALNSLDYKGDALVEGCAYRGVAQEDRTRLVSSGPQPAAGMCLIPEQPLGK